MRRPIAGRDVDHDVLIIGAGMSGMYQLYRLRALGLDVQVVEAGTGVGGTWYWNRYPGARFDSESYSYGYSWSPELLDDWNWSEHFAAQPETLRYLNHVADRFGLRSDIRFETRVQRCTFDENANCWILEAEDGYRASCWLLITALGPLSAPAMPAIEGVDDFEGEWHHTGLWPHDPVPMEGRRVGIIGTGASGVQTIQEVAKTAGSLTVFQRNPNWCAPLNNSPIEPDEMEAIRARYDEIFAQCRSTHGQFLHGRDPRSAFDVSDEERLRIFEELYASPGFGIWIGSFKDTLVDAEANALMSEFVANKIRERVNDPSVAERLIPTNHGFGTRRVPMESGYYEVYNQDNVELVDLRDSLIERITPTGVATTAGHHELDLLIYATGFDAVTGSFDRIEIRGSGGQLLKDKWDRDLQTFLGVAVSGFPNLLTLVGPQNSSTFCNIPRCIEDNVDWMTTLIEHMLAEGYERVETTPEAETWWAGLAAEAGSMLLMDKVVSWLTGFNHNVGRNTRRHVSWAGGSPAYREHCASVADNGYDGFLFDQA